MSGAKVRGGRAQVFAQGALKKGLVTRAQAEECLRIAHNLKAKGKSLPIEAIFVRKGYLRRAEAASLVKRIQPRGSQPALDLVPEERPSRGRCPSCERRPGDDDDCFHCGADLETGGPGPRGTICGSCQGVVLRGSALCLHCGQTIREPRRRGGGGGNAWLDRLIVLATVLGVGYFLIYRNLVAPPPPSDAVAPAPTPDAGQAPDRDALALLERARDLARSGKRDEALSALREGLAGASPAGARTLRRGLALLGEGEEAERAAQALLSEGEDAELRRRLAELAWAKGPGTPPAARAAKRELERIPREARGDLEWRLLAAAERTLDGDWRAPLLELREPRPAERVPLALALWERALGRVELGERALAKADLERAAELAPDQAELQRNLGALYLQLGQAGEAKRAYQRALKADPTGTPATQLGLALALERLNERTAARRFLSDYLARAEAAGEPAARIAAARARLERLSADPSPTPTPGR